MADIGPDGVAIVIVRCPVSGFFILFSLCLELQLRSGGGRFVVCFVAGMAPQEFDGEG